MSEWQTQRRRRGGKGKDAKLLLAQELLSSLFSFGGKGQNVAAAKGKAAGKGAKAAGKGVSAAGKGARVGGCGGRCVLGNGGARHNGGASNGGASNGGASESEDKVQDGERIATKQAPDRAVHQCV